MAKNTGPNPHPEIAERVQRVREAFGVSQADAARIAGVSLSTWNGWETGYARLSLDGARRLKAAWGISLDYLFEGDISGLSASLIKSLSLR